MTLVCFTQGRPDSDAFIRATYRVFCDIMGVGEKELSIDRSGKPKFLPEGSPYFSLSHSGEYTVCAMSDVEIGIDVQIKKDVDAEGISERFFGEKVNSDRFFDEFTKGEATTKRYGVSLTEGLLKREGKNYYFFNGYSLAICGGDTAFFCEIKDEL